jgi:hypothetical protein
MGPRTCACACMCVHVQVQVQVCIMCACVCVCVHVHVWVWVCALVLAAATPRLATRTHARTHARTHLQVPHRIAVVRLRLAGVVYDAHVAKHVRPALALLRRRSRGRGPEAGGGAGGSMLGRARVGRLGAACRQRGMRRAQGLLSCSPG